MKLYMEAELADLLAHYVAEAGQDHRVRATFRFPAQAISSDFSDSEQTTDGGVHLGMGYEETRRGPRVEL